MNIGKRMKNWKNIRKKKEGKWVQESGRSKIEKQRGKCGRGEVEERKWGKTILIIEKKWRGWKNGKKPRKIKANCKRYRKNMKK